MVQNLSVELLKCVKTRTFKKWAFKLVVEVLRGIETSWIHCFLVEWL